MSTLLASVVAAGVATVQDGGRHGFTHIGVPTSGALHRQRYLVATALLHERPDDRCPAIELLAGRLELVAATDLVIGVVGPARVSVGDRQAAAGAAVLVPVSARLVIELMGPGPAYLVVAGWSAPRTLGSAATDTFSRLGGAVMQSGAELSGSVDPTAAARVGAFHRPLPDPIGPIRVIGTRHGALPAFLASVWTVATVARSGVRLRPSMPPAASLAGVATMPSAPMVPGAIQLTPGGEPIVLGPDGGLTGGYPVMAVVATVDLDRIGTLAVGEQVRFREVEVAEATRAREAQIRNLRSAVTHVHHLP